MLIRSTRLALLTTIACAMVAQAQSPTGSVRGVVRAQGRQPLSGASVLLRSLKTGQTFTMDTSATGEYNFPSVAAGEYEIVAIASGMKPMNGTRVTVTAGQTTSSAIRMDRADASAIVSIVASEDTIATRTAPSQGSLTARSAQSDVRDEFVRQFTAPVVDYTQVVQMAPGMFSYSPNGPGLGDTKTFFLSLIHI